MVKVKVILLVFLLFSFNAKGVDRIKEVTPFYSGNNLLLELVASFNMGSIDECPELLNIDTFQIGDSLYFRAYYDVSGIWPANFCQSIDTVDLGQLPASLKMIRIDMYTTMYIPVDNDTDTTYCPQPWIIWLPLSIKEALPDEISKIFPNPNSGEFILQNEPEGVLTLEIVDVMGKVVYTDNTPRPAGKMKREINIGDAPPGLYTLRLITDKGLLVRKFVVE